MSSLVALSGSEIRSKFLKFYEERGHKILPSASLVPEDPTVLLTIAGMLPFKPIFLGQREAEVPRATTAQKCIRTNDIENVGRTKRHHTFFEMLGNFSFGDYFKKQAIAWGWELVTEVFGLPPENLIVSIFHEDEDAFGIWRDDIGIPAHRIQRMGDDNFWASGVTGPCGPCSEIYYDFKPSDPKIDLEDGDRFLEIYNLVFMELNRNSDGSFTPLKKQNIDTGLGLERMAQVLQGVPNNYETDLIFPILKTAADMAGVDYHASSEKTKTSLKIIGDHIRAVVHMIADGITASNVGRGYILRRLLRRVVRHGKQIGISGEFTTVVAETAIALSELAYPNVRERAEIIKSELSKEENRFLQTLERGEKLLAEILANPEIQASKIIKGTDAFTLYDTYGFPFELTQEIAEEEGLLVDEAGFKQAMQEQQERSKDAHVDIDLLTQINWSEVAKQVPKTEFIGYVQTQAESVVKGILINGKVVDIAKAGDRIQIILNQTPFYAESGGQIGDKGYISLGDVIIRIDDVQKESDLFIHIGQVERGEIEREDLVVAQVSVSDRRRIQAHHTSTHLLQAALKKLVDPNISQAGSLVTGDRLRFDYNLSRAITTDEIKEIENLINTWILDAHNSEITIMPIAEAKAKGAIAMFGEKYGAEVRVLDIGNVSMELCGGTHVANTSEIGIFKIISESGVASGIRRIEALAGQAVVEYLNIRDGIVKDLSDRFKIKPEEICDRITSLQTELKNSQKQTEILQRELALIKSDNLITQAEVIGDFKILVAEIAGIDADSLKIAAERLQSKLGENSAVVLGSIPEPEKVSLVAAFSPEVIKKGLNAGKFIGAIAKITGGGGGGRPNLAQAGGKEPNKLTEALSIAKAELKLTLRSRV